MERYTTEHVEDQVSGSHSLYFGDHADGEAAGRFPEPLFQTCPPREAASPGDGGEIMEQTVLPKPGKVKIGWNRALAYFSKPQN